MDHVAPAGPVYQAGTMSGHPVAMAAGLATLEIIERDSGFYEGLETLGAALERGVSDAIDRTAERCRLARVGSMWTLFFTGHQVTDWTTAATADRARYGRFFHAMLSRGISLAPSQFEANFISAAHTAVDVAATVDAIAGALEETRG